MNLTLKCTTFSYGGACPRTPLEGPRSTHHSLTKSCGKRCIFILKKQSLNLQLNKVFGDMLTFYTFIFQSKLWCRNVHLFRIKFGAVRYEDVCTYTERERVRVLRPLHTESEIVACVFPFFRIPHPFLSKCMQRMRKRRKSNLIRIFFEGRKFQRQCANVIDTTWGRIYFLTCEHFGWKCDSVCRDLYTHMRAHTHTRSVNNGRRQTWYQLNLIIVLNRRNVVL